jgi:uncharacterized zinc-type alcohol dehydrogenase-like protein
LAGNDLKTAPTGAEIVSAYAALNAAEDLCLYQYSAKALGPLEVEIRISHCGICHSDLHLINNDWGVSSYPLVPGHEIIGTVAQFGSSVKSLQQGQRVGVGWLAGSCFECEQCRQRRENLCARARPTCIGREGGYATHIRVDSRFAAVIPDALSSEYAAPLMCAGITVFAPLRRHGVNSATRLGVIGIGGLGHLAIMYGRAMGCHVTVFSSSPAKERDAQQMGANDFAVVNESGAPARQTQSCDFLLATVPVALPWAEYMHLLKPNGKLCIVGASPGEVRIPVFDFLDGQKSVTGSAVGSNKEIREMLQFSARHKITPKIELFLLRDVNQALKRLRKNDLRYRAVLVNEL